MDCIFCKIIAGEIPANKVFEDEKVVAFMDIFPSTVGHLLLVPKKHFKDMLEADDETLSVIAVHVPKIARAAMAATGATGFNVGINTGAAAGQVVMHLHWHIMPRYENDGLQFWKPIEQTPEELTTMAEKIRSAI